MKQTSDIGNFTIEVIAFQTPYILRHKDVDGRYVLFCNDEYVDESSPWAINDVHYELSFQMPDGVDKPANIRTRRSYTWALRKKIWIQMDFDRQIILEYEGLH